MKYKIMILVLSLTACTATLKTPQGNELSWNHSKQDPGPARLPVKEEARKENDFLISILLYAPAALVTVWMITTYLRESKND